MSNEIKFRGICAISKEMVFGDLIHGVGYKKENLYILPNEKNLANVKHCDPLDGVRVIPESVGQLIGLKDKNGIDIYSGDFDQDGQVVRWCDNRNGWAMSIYDFPTKEHIACHCYNCEGNFELSEITKEIEIKGNINELK